MASALKAKLILKLMRVKTKKFNSEKQACINLLAIVQSQLSNRNAASDPEKLLQNKSQSTYFTDWLNVCFIIFSPNPDEMMSNILEIGFQVLFFIPPYCYQLEHLEHLCVNYFSSLSQNESPLFVFLTHLPTWYIPERNVKQIRHLWWATHSLFSISSSCFYWHDKS